MRPKIFIVADWYVPGYKAGGLITALSNLADFIGGAFTLFIFTRDRDLTDKSPYADVPRMNWESVGKARVLYTSDLSLRHIRKRIFEVMPDIIYLNSFFSTLTIKTLFLRKLGLLPDCAFVVAPRGELSPGALEIKSLKKTVYRDCALRTGLYSDVVWHASSALEGEHISTALRSQRGKPQLIHIASDLPSLDWLRATGRPSKGPKSAGARFLFLSRISPMKNLLFAIEMLRDLKGHVELDIFGPIDDQEYWKDCQKQFGSLPTNIVVRYRGMVPRQLVSTVALDYDFFLLPTLGENFGYVILEAMAAGCPVIVSDQTPWRHLAEQKVGWALPLDEIRLWRSVLQQCVDMEPEAYATLSLRARAFVEEWATATNRGDETVQLFRRALERKSQGNHPSSLGESRG